MSDSAAGGSDDFLDVLRDTRARYVAGFADQLDHMRSLIAQTGDERLAALRTVAHRMAGLSGTLGFGAVGAAAAELEALVDAAFSGDAFSGDAALGLVQRIGDAFTADLAVPPPWASTVSAAPASAPIMVVEDDDDQRAIVRGYLEKAGYATVGVATGDAVLGAAKREKPGLILLDVHLPGMDGYSVCRQLKSDIATRAIPIVFVTTRAALNERLAGLTLGADDYITKPADITELLIRVARLTRAAGPPGAAAEPALSDYEDWLDAARHAVSSGAAAIALLRVPPQRRDAIAATLAQHLRRRDRIGAYDRSHLLVLLPEEGAARAGDQLRAILCHPDLSADGIAAGVASGAGGDAEGLVAEADEALAAARHTGVPVALHADRAARAAPATGARTVLLADDDPDVMRIVDAHMRGLGFRTVIAFDGQAALSQLSQKPDVVVLDLMMPKMTGFEVLQQISRLDPPRPKVIVLSARGREADVTRAFDLGADDYVVKPFSPQELGARIGRLLR